MPNVKERAEDMAITMNDRQQAAIRMLANQLHRLNSAVTEAVDSGLSIELQRASRHHNQDGYWGDLLTPIVVKQR
ncbi:MAG: hypothetical protein MEP57_06475 [Microvirga sp.]|nr:hypothetical protein [Microvirga sp.]